MAIVSHWKKALPKTNKDLEEMFDKILETHLAKHIDFLGIDFTMFSNSMKLKYYSIFIKYYFFR